MEYLKDTEDLVHDNWEDKKLMEKVSQDNIDLLLGETIPMPKEILDVVPIANNKSNHETKFEKFQEMADDLKTEKKHWSSEQSFF